MKSLRLILLLGLLPVLQSCESFGDPAACPPRHVNVITQQGNSKKGAKLEVRPETIVIKPGCSFELRFTAGKEVSTSSGKSWLGKSMTSTSPIVMAAPAGEPEGIYKYNVMVTDFGSLDPRARVKN